MTVEDCVENEPLAISMPRAALCHILKNNMGLTSIVKQIFIEFGMLSVVGAILAAYGEVGTRSGDFRETNRTSCQL